MLKKLTFIFLILSLLIHIFKINNQPIFSDYASSFEICFESNSSVNKFVTVSKDEFSFIYGIKGQSFKTAKNDFNLNQFLQKEKAKVVFFEKIEEGTSCYAYSSKIKNHLIINGKKVNIQIFLGEEVTVGSPIIFGSF